MRINPDFFKDPDPEPDVSADIEEVLSEGFKVINTLDDLPQDKIDELDKISERVAEMIEHEEIVNSGKTRCSDISHFRSFRFMASAVLANVHAMPLMLVKTIDEKEDRKDGSVDEKINEIIDSGLPIIRIVKEWDEMYTYLELEMEDDTKAMLCWGKEVATDDDYSEIASRGLEGVCREHDRKKKEEAESDEDNN